MSGRRVRLDWRLTLRGPTRRTPPRPAFDPALRRSSPLLNRFGHFAGGEHVRLPREDLVDQHAMHLLIAVGAAVFDDDEPVISVCAVAHGRENHSARCDAEE